MSESVNGARTDGRQLESYPISSMRAFGSGKLIIYKHINWYFLSIFIILKQLHDDLGHQGRDRTLSLMQSMFYWPGLENKVEEQIKNCDRCNRQKTHIRPSADFLT